MPKTTFIAKLPSRALKRKMEQAPKPAGAPKPKSRNMVLAIIIIVILVVVGVGVYILTRPPSAPTIATPIKIYDGNPSCNPQPINCGFNPATITIKLGNSTVTWTNTGGAPHTVVSNQTANGNLPTFNSGVTLNNGNQYTYTFTQAGTYHYYCSIHSYMQAVVIVTS